MKIGFLCWTFVGVIALISCSKFLDRATPPAVAVSQPAPDSATASVAASAPLPPPAPIVSAVRHGDTTPARALDAPAPSVAPGHSLDAIIQSLLAVAEDSSQDPAQALTDLKSWLSEHPTDGLQSMLQILQGTSTNQWNLSALLIRGLTEAGSATGDQALLSILSYANSFPPNVAVQATIAAGDLGVDADPLLKRTLLNLIDWPVHDSTYRLSETALFSFARVAGHDPDYFGFLVQRLNPLLEDNAAPRDTAKAFTLLAQAGLNAPDFVQRAAHFARSADADVRQAVEEYVTSLSWGGSPDVQ